MYEYNTSVYNLLRIWTVEGAIELQSAAVKRRPTTWTKIRRRRRLRRPPNRRHCRPLWPPSLPVPVVQQWPAAAKKRKVRVVKLPSPPKPARKRRTYLSTPTR